jgi:hypothetical protein
MLVMMDLADLFDHAHGKFGVFIGKLDTDLIVAIGSTAPDNGSGRLEGRLPNRDFDLDDTAS